MLARTTTWYRWIASGVSLGSWPPSPHPCAMCNAIFELSTKGRGMEDLQAHVSGKRECGCPVETGFNRENMIKWIKALQSGRFPQGVQRLATKDLAIEESKQNWAYCCLGVACEVALEDGVDMEVQEPYLFNGSSMSRKSYDSHSVNLPERVLAWLGLRLSDEDVALPTVDFLAENRELPQLTGYDLLLCNERAAASFLNDALLYNFLQIAEAIKHRFDISQEEVDAAP